MNFDEQDIDDNYHKKDDLFDENGYDENGYDEDEGDDESEVENPKSKVYESKFYEDALFVQKILDNEFILNEVHDDFEKGYEVFVDSNISYEAIFIIEKNIAKLKGNIFREDEIIKKEQQKVEEEIQKNKGFIPNLIYRFNKKNILSIVPVALLFSVFSAALFILCQWIHNHDFFNNEVFGLYFDKIFDAFTISFFASFALLTVTRYYKFFIAIRSLCTFKIFVKEDYSKYDSNIRKNLRFAIMILLHVVIVWLLCLSVFDKS